MVDFLELGPLSSISPMTFQQLKADISKINLHPLAETGIESLSIFGTDLGIVFNGDNYEIEVLKDEIEQERNANKELEREKDELNTENRQLTEKITQLESLLDQATEEGASNLIESFKKERDDAVELRNILRKQRDEAISEMTFLRKRKGIEAGFVRYFRDVVNFLDKTPEGREISAKIREKQNES